MALNKMTTIIEDPELGTYYKGLIPYVGNMGVSLDIESSTYSLECDKTYDHTQRIGIFYGYPGSIGSDGKLIPGINYANGMICYHNSFNKNYDYLEVINGTIRKVKIEETGIEETSNEESDTKELSTEENTYNNPNNSLGHKIIPQCTIVECNININSELTVHRVNSSNKICGKFFGTPGEYYYDNSIKRYNRKYGNEHSVGTITLNGRFNFQYCYDKGKISSCIFNSRNSLKWIKSMKSIDL